MDFLTTLKNLWNESGFLSLDIPHLVMIIVACVLIYLAIRKKFEPLLLLPIAFGMLLANLPITGLMSEPVVEDGHVEQIGGLLYYLYQGVKLGIYPSLYSWVSGR
jgi:oxaloacetate decarboxylase beta subunit